MPPKHGTRLIVLPSLYNYTTLQDKPSQSFQVFVTALTPAKEELSLPIKIVCPCPANSSAKKDNVLPFTLAKGERMILCSVGSIQRLLVDYIRNYRSIFIVSSVITSP